MPRLSQADAELVMRFLEQELNAKGVESAERGTRALWQVLARLKTRIEKAPGSAKSAAQRSVQHAPASAESNSVAARTRPRAERNRVASALPE